MPEQVHLRVHYGNMFMPEARHCSSQHTSWAHFAIYHALQHCTDVMYVLQVSKRAPPCSFKHQ
jgi:hypothetical protein